MAYTYFIWTELSGITSPLVTHGTINSLQRTLKHNRPLSQPTNSRFREHTEETKHELVFNNSSVLSRCNDFDMKITESVLTNKLRTFLKNRDASIPLNILRWNFFNNVYLFKLNFSLCSMVRRRLFVVPWLWEMLFPKARPK